MALATLAAESGQFGLKTELDSQLATRHSPLPPLLYLLSPLGIHRGFYDANATACHIFNLPAQLDTASLTALSSCSSLPILSLPLPLSCFFSLLFRCHFQCCTVQ